MLRIALIAFTLAVASADFEAKWAIFKDTYNKSYVEEEDLFRREIYAANLEIIEIHNQRYANGETSFFLGENRFADMTNEEFVATMNGLRLKTELEDKHEAEPNVAGLPATVDWREKGFVTPVKDQGQCGSCWAFSTTGSLEGQHFNATGRLVSLSESNLVDCSSAEGNMGCNGGLMDQAFQYVIDNHGIDTEASYPYVPRDERCHFKASNIGATIKSFKDVQKGSEKALQLASATIGPISVGIDASNLSFQFYKGGVYDEPNCSSTQLDHGVLVVGYGTYRNTEYWLVKNSWAEVWGLKGYIMMSRNKSNQCGIATAASYPVV